MWNLMSGTLTKLVCTSIIYVQLSIHAPVSVNPQNMCKECPHLAQVITALLIVSRYSPLSGAAHGGSPETRKCWEMHVLICCDYICNLKFSLTRSPTLEACGHGAAAMFKAAMFKQTESI